MIVLHNSGIRAVLANLSRTPHQLISDPCRQALSGGKRGAA
jgi:hypothetical protein